MNRLLSAFFFIEQSHTAQQQGQACFSSRKSNKAIVSWGNEAQGGRAPQTDTDGDGWGSRSTSLVISGGWIAKCTNVDRVTTEAQQRP